MFLMKFEPQINSGQIQTQFSSWNFNSNVVWNLNFFRKGPYNSNYHLAKFGKISSTERFAFAFYKLISV
jgi:hypothetical protein